MKHWIGYVVALIFAACTWALKSFAATHSLLVDIIYPYVTRLVMAFLALKTSKTGLCIWQIVVVIFALFVLASIVYYVWRKKNPVRCIGWTLALICAVNLVSTGLFGLNQYSGALADDIRLETPGYVATDLHNALTYYQEHANALAESLPRDSSGNIIADFDSVTNKAGDGFKVLSQEQYYSVFAGNATPVKKMGWAWAHNLTGSTNKFYPITGEAVVNENTPSVGLPYAVCRVMSQRICISNDPDSAMAGILACINNPDPVFQYSGYFMAYRYCYDALSTMPGGAEKFRAQENEQLKRDFDTYESSFARRDDRPSGIVPQASGEMKNIHVGDLLVSWHLQHVVKPMTEVEEAPFDPLDETHENLSDLHGIKQETTEPTTEGG